MNALVTHDQKIAASAYGAIALVFAALLIWFPLRSQYANEGDALAVQLESAAALLESSGVNTRVQQELALLDFIEAHPDETAEYLVKQRSVMQPKAYTTILKYYVLRALPGGYPDDGLTDRSSSAPYTIFDVLRDEVGFDTAVDIEVNERPDGTYLAQVRFLYMSGAYNILSSFYLVDIQDSTVKITKLLPLRIDKQGAISPADLYNAAYVAQSDVVEEYGFLPFGLYPCNSIQTFRIDADRLIQIKEEEKTACHGISIETPDDAESLPEETDFTARQTVYTVSQSALTQAKLIDLKSLPPINLEY